MKRSSYLKHDDVIELGKRGIQIWCYGKTRRYVCRLEVNAAGLAVYTGKTGKKLIADVSWERLIEKLTA